MGRRLKREGTHVYLQLIHVVVWQQLTQHCNYPPIKNISEKRKKSSVLFIRSFVSFGKRLSEWMQNMRMLHLK